MSRRLGNKRNLHINRGIDCLGCLTGFFKKQGLPAILLQLCNDAFFILENLKSALSNDRGPPYRPAVNHYI